MNHRQDRDHDNVRSAISSEARDYGYMDHRMRERHSNLMGAALAGMPLREVAWRGQDLSFADLTGADLSHADLVEADLTIAEMTLADLSGANLCQANLFGADLFGANLRGANLTGAWLGGADLDEADLSDTVLKNALYDRDTRWPEGFQPQLSGAILILDGQRPDEIP